MTIDSSFFVFALRMYIYIHIQDIYTYVCFYIYIHIYKNAYSITYLKATERFDEPLL